MKKIFFISVTAIFCIFNSCTDSPASPAMDESKAAEQKNLAASDVVMKAFQTGDISGLDSVVADDYIDHGERGDTRGVDSLKSMVKFVKANYADMKFDKVRDVADGDYVYSWINYSGTGDGTNGMPKGPYKTATMEVSKFRDGKAVEHWAFIDAQDMAKMMQPPPANDTKTDAAKMKK